MFPVLCLMSPAACKPRPGCTDYSMPVVCTAFTSAALLQWTIFRSCFSLIPADQLYFVLMTAIYLNWMFSNLFYWHYVSANDRAWHSCFWIMGVWLVACSGGGICARCFTNFVNVHSFCQSVAHWLCTENLTLQRKANGICGCFMLLLSHSLCYFTKIEVGGCCLSLLF